MLARRSFALALAGLAVCATPGSAESSARLVVEGGGRRLPLPPEAIAWAEASPDGYDITMWKVTLRLREPAKWAFAEMTAALVGQPLAVLWDGAPIANPRVMTAIVDGELVISGLVEIQARRIARLATYSG